MDSTCVFTLLLRTFLLLVNLVDSFTQMVILLSKARWLWFFVYGFKVVSYLVVGAFSLTYQFGTLQFKVRLPSHELNWKDLYLIFPRQNQTGHGNHFIKRIHLNFSKTIHHSQSISSQTLAKRIISTTVQIKLFSNNTRSSSNKKILGFWHPITLKWISIFIHQIIYVDCGRITSLW